jgi:hypothetical protein
MERWGQPGHVSVTTLVGLREQGKGGCEATLSSRANAHVNVSGIVNIIAQGEATVK